MLVSTSNKMGGRARGVGPSRGGGGLIRRGDGNSNRGSRFLSVEEEDRIRRGRNAVVDVEAMESDPYVEPVEPFDTSSRRGSVASMVRNLEGGSAGEGGGISGEGGGLAGTNEFEVGARMMEVSATMRSGVGEVLRRISGQDLGVEDLKAIIKEGLNVMMDAVEKVMNVVGDSVQKERRERVLDEGRKEERLGSLEAKVRENTAGVEAAKGARERLLRKESVKGMEEKIRLANRQLKFVDIDFGRQTNNRREIVEKTISYMREDVNLADRKRFDILLRRTRIIVLGKGTVTRMVEDTVTHNVPVLLEMRSEADKVEMEEILRAVNWYAVYHWPGECVEFVKGVRNEVRKMGYEDHKCYVKIRPEEREGRMQIKAEVKERTQGARFKLAAVWAVPPLDKALWGNDTFRYRAFGPRQGGE